MFVLISNPNQFIGPKMAVLSCKITFFFMGYIADVQWYKNHHLTLIIHHTNYSIS